MTIRTQDAFEAALEEVVRRLDANAASEAETAELGRLMAEIDAYRPTFTAPADAEDDLSRRAQDLIARARALRAACDAHTSAPWNSLPTDGRGVGPTTGV